jgi:hypothetical protein
MQLYGSSLGESDRLWASPEYFPIHILPAENVVVFVALSRQLYRTSAFLDGRYLLTGESRPIPLDMLDRMSRTVAPADRRPVHCIFHVAFCGSTLVARCLDRLTGAFVLKEPLPFHEVAFYKRHGRVTAQGAEAWLALFELMMALLGRTFDPRDAAIVKPTDASTALMGDVLAYSDSSAALFLHVGLKEFLASILNDESRRAFVRERLNDLFVLGRNLPLFHGVDWRTLTDAERAACLWLLHRHLYVEFVNANPNARCRSLDFQEFLRAPVPALGAIACLFGIRASPEEIEAAIRSETALHSKTRTDFTAADREKKQSAVAKIYRQEIHAGLMWAGRRIDSHAVMGTLPRPLDIDLERSPN